MELKNAKIQKMKVLEMKFTYVVEMLRWGEAENHSYVEGVYTRLEAALEAGLAHAEFGDYKYEPRVSCHEIGAGKRASRIIVEDAEQARALLEEFKTVDRV